MDKIINWVIIVDDTYPLTDIKKQLKKNGFKINNVLKEINCITGSASTDVIKKIRSIPGISNISKEGPPVSSGPPDSSIVW